MIFIAEPRDGRGKSYYQTSKCGAYCVSAARIENDWYFSAWHLKQPIGTAATIGEGQLLCREHHKAAQTAKAAK